MVESKVGETLPLSWVEWQVYIQDPQDSLGAGSGHRSDRDPVEEEVRGLTVTSPQKNSALVRLRLKSLTSVHVGPTREDWDKGGGRGCPLPLTEWVPAYLSRGVHPTLPENSPFSCRREGLGKDSEGCFWLHSPLRALGGGRGLRTLWKWGVLTRPQP